MEGRPADQPKPEGADGLLRTAWRYAWVWVPTLYFAQGVPNQIVTVLSGDLYILLGVDEALMATATAWLSLPWVIKPLWSPFVEAFGSRRMWIVGSQATIAVALCLVAWVLPGESFFVWSLALFWLIAFASATHDIAADGFYIEALPGSVQAWFVGVRSTFFRLAIIFVVGGMLQLAGVLDDSMSVAAAWSWTFTVAAVLFGLFALYHAVSIPASEAAPRRPDSDSVSRLESILIHLGETLTTFFSKPGIVPAMAFLLLYRFSEGQLTKFARPFLFASRDEGGAGLEVETVAIIYGYAGTAMLTLGGILGGIAATRGGLRRWLLPMALAMNLPNALYAILAAWLPGSGAGETGVFDVGLFGSDVTLTLDAAVVAVVVMAEQFGYGFGFAAYLLYMIHLARGEHATTHYAVCTGFMALGLAIAGYVSGPMLKSLGYSWFFVWVVVATIPSLLVTAYIARTVPEGEFAVE